eukprot:COSAG06_NODE_10173_length_1735_cov_6.757946_1_plen_202_part_00
MARAKIESPQSDTRSQTLEMSTQRDEFVRDELVRKKTNSWIVDGIKTRRIRAILELLMAQRRLAQKVKKWTTIPKLAEHLLAFSRLASIQQHPPPFYTSIHRSIRFRHPRRFGKPPTTDPKRATSALTNRRRHGRSYPGARVRRAALRGSGILPAPNQLLPTVRREQFEKASPMSRSAGSIERTPQSDEATSCPCLPGAEF